MPSCEYCGAEVELPFKCNFCGSHLCMEHRLPENHDCRREPPRTPLGSWQSKNTLRAKKSKWNIMDSEGDFHFRKKTPVLYEPKRRKPFPVKKTLAVVTILVVVFITGLFFYTGFPFLAEPKPEINMQQKIKDEIQGTYSIVTYDWVVWSKTFRDSGGILTKMDTWEQFKESYRQSIKPITIELDEVNRVVWFKGAINHVIYYEY